MSKVIDTVRSGVKSVVRGVKKVFKEVTRSKVGRAMLVAGAIYLGGAALGAWNSPFQSLNGVLAGGAGGGGSGTAASLIEGGTTAAAPTGFTPATAATTMPGAGGTINTAAIGAPSAAAPAAAAPGGFTASTAGSTMQGAGGTINLSSLGSTAAAAPAPTASASPGMIQSIMTGAKKTGEWAQRNPIPAVMGLNAIASATSPDEIDMLREEDRLIQRREDEERERRNRNLDIAGIDLGVRPSGRPLTDMQGNPIWTETGMINKARYGI